jgi:aspartyl protease family protein
MSPNNNPNHQSTHKLGKTFVFLAWVILILMMTYFFDNIVGVDENPNEEVATNTLYDGSKTVLIQSNPNNQYIITGEINQKKVVFLVDTGATDVVIPGRIANKLNLQKGTPVTAHTASDKITVYLTRLEQLKIGEIELYNIRANINPYMPGNYILLGMSALKDLQLLQKKGTLKIIQNPQSIERY